VLENDLLRVEVLPALGGKIWSIVYKPRNRELLWHHPDLAPHRVEPGSSFDDAFFGGWDEVFPNDAPVTLESISYPDHGEVWTAVCDWRVVEQSIEQVTIALTCTGAVTGASIERHLTLRADEPSLRVSYRVLNASDAPLIFQWKLHPALNMGPNARIDIPAGRFELDPEFAEELAELEGEWPIVAGKNGEPIDLRIAPDPASKAIRFFYATDLTDGWCSMTDLDDGTVVRFEFDRIAFPAITVFGTYGGWQGIHTTILEPCTGYPYRLEEALAIGRVASLEPGAMFETAVMFRVEVYG
jgi:galactose mutarotase-like enzyme